jgi:hypothetical protein
MAPMTAGKRTTQEELTTGGRLTTEGKLTIGRTLEVSLEAGCFPAE